MASKPSAVLRPGSKLSLSRSQMLAALCVAGAGAIAYHNSFGGGFIFDDWVTIVQNPTIRDWRDVKSVVSPPPSTTATGRPLLNITLALNYAWSGYEVWSYHLVNLLIHLSAGLLLFGVIRRALDGPLSTEATRGAATPIAATVALLWTVHPLQTQTVTYIVQRAEALMGLDYLATLYAVARAGTEPGRKRWSLVAVIACFLGMASKEPMASAPFVALLYDRAFFAGSFRAAWQRRRVLYVGLACSWLFLAALIWSTGLDRDGSKGFGNGNPALDYWLTQPRAICRYLQLSFWPNPLVFEYGVEWARQVREVLPYAVIVAGLVAGTVAAFRWWPKWAVLGSLFFGVLAPSSLMPAQSQMTVEHRMYLPLAAVLCGIVYLAWQRFGRGALVCATLVGVVFGALTIDRNRDYRDGLSLWRDTLDKRPQHPIAHRIYADHLLHLGDQADSSAFQRAINHYEESLRLAAGDAETHENFAAALFFTGDIEAGIHHCHEALRLSPNRWLAHYNLGLALAGSGRMQQALTHFERAVRARPDHAKLREGLANALSELGRPAEALPHYEEALRLDPNDGMAHYNLGNALFKLGRFEASAKHYTNALTTRPDDADTHRMLGETLKRLGRSDEAGPYLLRASDLEFANLLSRKTPVSPRHSLPLFEPRRR